MKQTQQIDESKLRLDKIFEYLKTSGIPGSCLEDCIAALLPAKQADDAAIQNLLDTWERRPRRQLDYSQLTPESLTDLEWTNDFLKSFIPAARAIAYKYGLTPAAPIMLHIAPPANATVGTTHPDDKNGVEHDPARPTASEAQNPNLSTPPLEQGSDTPSKAPETKPAAAPSSGTPKTREKKGRTGAKKDHEPGSARTPAAAPAKPAVAPVIEPPPTLPATASEPKPNADLSDPPAPTLSEIG